MSANLQNPIFSDETKAREWLETRVWPNGVVCRHCGNADAARIALLKGKASRPGVYQCAECREQFTVTVGTVFERSKIPLTKWLMALFLLVSSKKGVSAHQIHRSLGVSYKSAWFMMHRLRHAMRTGGFEPPMGGEGKTVEIDETYIGKKEGVEVRRGSAHKHIVLSLVERGGSARSFHVDSTKKEDIAPILRANIARESHVMTDESNTYRNLHKDFAKHGVVDHSRKEYGYTDRDGEKIGTNTVEGYYSVFKRGMKGVYQHCGEKHLHRYVAEFDFRYSNRSALGVEDAERAEKLAAGISGKRLTYRRIGENA